MRRYWLFGGDTYYASGGFHDFRGSFDTIEHATDDAKTRPSDVEHPKRGPIEWWHIFDSEAEEIVEQSECKALGASEFPQIQ